MDHATGHDVTEQTMSSARALLNRAQPNGRRHAIDAMAEAFADFYVPDRGVVLGTGAWLVGASRTI